MADFSHGGIGNGYTNHGCRCDECTEAHRVGCARRSAERRLEVPPVHGVCSTYRNWGCRCSECRVAASTVMRAYRERRKSQSA